MDCNKAAQYFSDYFEGVVSEPTKSRITEHLSLCQECGLSYSRFAHAMELLNEPLEELEAPSKIRTAVMAQVTEIAAKQKPSVLRSFLDYFIFDRGRAFKTTFAVGLSASVVLVAVYMHSNYPSRALSGGVAPSISATTPIYHGAFKSATISSTSDKLIYTSVIRLPSNVLSGSLKAYVIGNDDAFSSLKSISDPSNATLVWQSSSILTSNDIVTIPIAVPLTKSNASALVLMIESRSAQTGAIKRDIAIEPYGSSSDGSAVVPPDSSVLNTLRFLSSQQNQQIFVDNTALAALMQSGYSSTEGLSGSTSVDEVLSGIAGVMISSRTSNSISIIGQ